MPMVPSASVGCDGRAFVPMRWKMRLAPITIPMPTTKARHKKILINDGTNQVDGARGSSRLAIGPAA